MARRKNKTAGKAGRRHHGIAGVISLLVVLPLVLLNGVVSVAGRTPIFPLSVSHLKDKWEAAKYFGKHLPSCLTVGHDDNLELAIRRAEAKHHLPEGLLAALVKVESGGIPHRISRTGAMGLGQLMPATAKEMNVKDPFNPEEALDGSGKYLARQLARFKDMKLALAAYNAGPGNVRGNVPVNGETEYYVPRVMNEFARRQQFLREAPEPSRTYRDAVAPSKGAASARSEKAEKPEKAPKTETTGPSGQPAQSEKRPGDGASDISKALGTKSAAQPKDASENKVVEDGSGDVAPAQPSI